MNSLWLGIEKNRFDEAQAWGAKRYYRYMYFDRTECILANTKREVAIGDESLGRHNGLLILDGD